MSKVSLEIIKENEKLSEATIEEYCQYLYEEADGNVDGIPDYEMVLNYFFYVTKREYNLLYKRVKLAIENVADHFYNGKIELSNRATINKLYGNMLPGPAGVSISIHLRGGEIKISK